MRLRYTPAACAELDQVLTDIELESSRGALRIKTRVQSVIKLILQYPHAAPLRSKRGIRRIAVYRYPYLIFYKTTADELVMACVTRDSVNQKYQVERGSWRISKSRVNMPKGLAVPPPVAMPLWPLAPP